MEMNCFASLIANTQINCWVQLLPLAQRNHSPCFMQMHGFAEVNQCTLFECLERQTITTPEERALITEILGNNEISKVGFFKVYFCILL